MIYQMVQRQASMLAYVDVFKMMAIVFLAVIPVAMLLKKTKPGEAPIARTERIARSRRNELGCAQDADGRSWRRQQACRPVGYRRERRVALAQRSPARDYLRGNSELWTNLKFVRVEPYVIPKRSLTGESTKRVDSE